MNSMPHGVASLASVLTSLYVLASRPCYPSIRLGKYPLKACKLPHFFRWGSNSDVSFGWQTGQNNDLICLRPRISIELKEPALSVLLSPICSNRFLALFAFIVKVLLVRIDQNLKRCLGD